MLLLNKNNAVDNIIVTLFEKRLLAVAVYLFVFENVTTRSIVTFFKTESEELSATTERFNSFNISTSTLFTGDEGQYQYRIYEAPDSTTTDTTGLNLLECGKMLLQKSAPATVKAYTPTTTYKGYGG